MMLVRAAEPSDEPALAALQVATWSPQVTPGPVLEPGAAFFGDRLREEDVWVVDADDRLVGYLILCQPSSLASHGHALQINGLAVDPAYQGRGIGRLLVDEAKREAARRGARKVSLRVLATNETARRLYASCGFVVEGVLRDEFLLAGRFVDDVLMAHHLG